ncbi:hypothetical protein BDR26DRAFT_855546 [Obelidium mucronatum]|nr:hypothetical protein BDR26DRAFT_855546 [Obelidium mucronatum]
MKLKAADIKPTTSIHQQQHSCSCGSLMPCKQQCVLQKSQDVSSSISEFSGMNHRSAASSRRLSAANIAKSAHSKAPSSPRWSMLPSPSSGAHTSLLETALSKTSTIDRIASSPSTTGYSVFNSPKLSARSQSPGVGIFIQSSSSSSPMTRKRTSSITAFLGNSTLSSSLELSSVLNGNGSFGNEVALEKEFCKDFWCCGLVLEDLHELNKHIQEAHPELSPMTQADQSTLESVAGLDALFLNDLIPAGAFMEDNSDTLVDSESPQNPTESVSPKQSFFTPPTSMSPHMSPKSDNVAPPFAGFDEPEPFPFSEEDDVAFLFKHPRRRDSHDTLAHDEDSCNDGLLAFDPDLFEDTVVGVDILNRLGNIELQQADEALEQSLALMLLQPDFANPAEAGPLLNSGDLESRSPPVAPIVRFGPHHEDHEEIFPSSSISLAEIYQEDESSVDGLLFPLGSTSPKSPRLMVLSEVQSPQPYNYESSDDSDMAYSNHQKYDVGGQSSDSDEDFEIDIETWENAPSASSHLSPNYYIDDDDLLPGHPLQRYNSAPSFSQDQVFKVPRVPKRRPVIPLKIRLTSSAAVTRSSSTPSLASNKKSNILNSKSTKKMRVGSSSLLSVQVDPTSVITASSPVLTPPNALLRTKQHRGRNQGPVVDDVDEIETFRTSGSTSVSRRTSAEESGSRKLSRKSSSRLDEEGVELMEEEEDFYSPESVTGGNASKPRRRISAAPSRNRKTGEKKSGEPKAAAAQRPAKKAVVAPPEPVEEVMKLDPEFVTGGATLAELVLKRLPKVKAGEEKRLKLGSLSIIDPESAEKRFFCPVCKKEYKNANGLKVRFVLTCFVILDR